MTENVGAVQMAGLGFAAACSYRAASETGRARQKSTIEASVAQGLGPDEMMRLIERHRIQATAWDTLSRVGLESILGERVRDLRDASVEVRTRSLALAMAHHKVCDALRRSGIPALPLKGGPDLSNKLYGDLGLRQCKDLDLVLRPENLAGAVVCLESMGYAATSPVWMSSRPHRWLAIKVLRDFSLFDPVSGIEIELHHRFERIPDPSREALWWDGYLAAGTGLSVAEFVFLCVHGASHCWTRMKWLGDIAAWVDRHPQAFVECREFAARQELVPVLDHVAVLLRELFGIEPDGFADRRLDSKLVAGQVGFCQERMADPDFSGEFSFRRADVRIRMDLFRQSLVKRRAPLGQRLCHVALSILVRPKDVEALGRHWGWLFVLPFYRAGNMLGRYLPLLRFAAKPAKS